MDGTPSIAKHMAKLEELCSELGNAVSEKDWITTETLARELLGYASRLLNRAQVVNELRAEGAL